MHAASSWSHYSLLTTAHLDVFSMLSLCPILISDIIVTNLFMHSLPCMILLYLATPFLYQRCFCMRFLLLLLLIHQNWQREVKCLKTYRSTPNLYVVLTSSCYFSNTAFHFLYMGFSMDIMEVCGLSNKVHAKGDAVLCCFIKHSWELLHLNSKVKCFNYKGKWRTCNKILKEG